MHLKNIVHKFDTISWRKCKFKGEIDVALFIVDKTSFKDCIIFLGIILEYWVKIGWQWIYRQNYV